MFRIASKIYFTLFLALIFASLSYSQNNDKVKAAVSTMPSEMEAGSTISVTVTITNTGNNNWTNANVDVKELGLFDISKNWDVIWILEPGQSRDLQYNVTAPKHTGKHRMKIVVYNDGKRIGSRTKVINVVNSSTPNNK
jgi:uncharacterized membrane protein